MGSVELTLFNVTLSQHSKPEARGGEGEKGTQEKQRALGYKPIISSSQCCVGICTVIVQLVKVQLGNSGALEAGATAMVEETTASGAILQEQAV